MKPSFVPTVEHTCSQVGGIWQWISCCMHITFSCEAMWSACSDHKHQEIMVLNPDDDTLTAGLTAASWLCLTSTVSLHPSLSTSWATAPYSVTDYHHGREKQQTHCHVRTKRLEGGLLHQTFPPNCCWENDISPFISKPACLWVLALVKGTRRLHVLMVVGHANKPQ